MKANKIIIDQDKLKKALDQRSEVAWEWLFGKRKPMLGEATTLHYDITHCGFDYWADGYIEVAKDFHYPLNKDQWPCKTGFDLGVYGVW